MSLADVPGWAAQYVGIPYVPGGRSRAGADCWGLYSLVMAEQFGLVLPPYEGPNWGSKASARAVAAAAEAYARQFERVEASEARLGDAILMRTFGLPVHLGMVVTPGLMLHAEEYQDSVIARYTSFQWASRIVSFHRWTPNG
jgi:cell wall-associated NlpC family hydrolase